MACRPDLARSIPLGLTLLRVALAPVIVALAYAAPTPPAFAVCLTLAFLSDVFDGIVARRLGVATTALRRLDSIADTIFYVAATYVVWMLHSAALTGHLGGLLVLVALELARYALDLAKFRREASYHMWSAKAWGIALFLAFVAVLVFGRTGWPVSVAIWLGVLTDLEGIAASLLLPSWHHDVPTVVHAVRIRRAASS